MDDNSSEQFKEKLSALPAIVLAGRPNVGKSTIFNKLIRSNRAITHDRPGVTRDRLVGIVRRKDFAPFEIIDTGGITLNESSMPVDGPDGIRGFESEILAQTDAALKTACAVAFVVDGSEGLLPLDEHLARHLRHKNLPILCVVNKVDGIEHEDEKLSEFHALGFPLLAVSAEHGHNMNALLEDLVALIPEDKKQPADWPQEIVEKPALRLAMLGRPNAGKSSLINSISGQERLIVSDVAGTTRDSVDVRFEIKGKIVEFVDTAGIRRKTRITDEVEKFSVNSAIKTATKAQVTLFVVDAVEGIGQQDKRLMNLLVTKKIPFFILVNKCDLLPQDRLKLVKKEIEETLSFWNYVPILMVSAKTGKNLSKIMDIAESINNECQKRIPTGQLNRAMQSVLTNYQPPIVKRGRAKFFYLTQAEASPPTFVFFVSDAERVPETYARYLEKSLRKLFNIQSAPMRINFRSSHSRKK